MLQGLRNALPRLKGKKAGIHAQLLAVELEDRQSELLTLKDEYLAGVSQRSWD